MVAQLVEVTHANIAYTFLGGFVVLFSLVSLLIKERLYLGECILGTVFGIAIGPIGARLFEPRSWGNTNDITLEVMRIVLAAGVFAIGVELPKSYMAKHWKSLILLVLPTMAIGWFVSAALLVALFPRLSFVSALVLSSCLTPTDPILANAIVMGNFAVKHVPKHLRLLLMAESASNDGLAYPFLSLSLYLSLETSAKVVAKKWILIGCLYQVVLGILIGAILGTTFSFVLKFAQKRQYIDRESFVAQYLALTLFCIGISNMIGSDDLLTAFAAGSALSWDGEFNVQTENEVFSSILDLVLNCAAFIYIGAWIPFGDFVNPSLGITPWRLLVFAICLLLVRRIPAILALYKIVPDIEGWREALFCGHFGPMGVGAIYISTFALTKLPPPRIPPQNQLDVLGNAVQPIIAFTFLSSILIHGLSIPFFSLGKTLRSRTISLSSTWTLSRTVPNDETPEWLQSTQRIINGTKFDLPVVQAESEEAPNIAADTQLQNESHAATISKRSEIIETDYNSGNSVDQLRRTTNPFSGNPSEIRSSQGVSAILYNADESQNIRDVQGARVQFAE